MKKTGKGLICPFLFFVVIAKMTNFAE